MNLELEYSSRLISFHILWVLALVELGRAGNFPQDNCHLGQLPPEEFSSDNLHLG